MTQKINHHLNDAILMGYAAGTLPEAFNLLVAAHISLCDTCRAQAESYDALGGELLDRECYTDMQPSSLTCTLGRIENTLGDASHASTPVSSSILPTPLRNYVGGDLDTVKWKPVGMGVKQAILPTAKGATARLLLIPAGTAMPDHGHGGTEMTMVLSGAFQDDADYFARGDVETADSDTHHTPVADIHEDCICLAVADAPLKFDALIPRIAQRFLRI